MACYGTVRGPGPDDVAIETLSGFFAALEAEDLVKDPRGLLKHTIAVWNMCRTRLPGWPDTVLASPFKTAPAMLPLDALPAGLHADVLAWEERMRHPDPLDPTAPVRAMREATLEGCRFTVRRIGSALVRAGVPIEAITGLAILVEPGHAKAGLREYLPSKDSGQSTE